MFQKQLARLQEPNCELTSMDFRFRKIGEVEALAVELQNPNCKLTSLDLSWNYNEETRSWCDVACNTKSKRTKISN